MKSLFRYVVTLLLVGGWALAGSAVHVVRFGDRQFLVVPKEKLTYADTWADTRKWSLADLATHRVLSARLLVLDRLDVLLPTADPKSAQLPALVLGEINRPTTAPSTSPAPATAALASK